MNSKLIRSYEIGKDEFIKKEKNNTYRDVTRSRTDKKDKIAKQNSLILNRGKETVNSRYTVKNAQNRFRKIKIDVDNRPEGYKLIGGNAGNAKISNVTKDIINRDKTNIGKEFIRKRLEDNVKENLIKKPLSAIYANKTWKIKRTKDKYVLKTIGGYAEGKALKAIGIEDRDDSLSDRTINSGRRYGYKAGKYTAIGVFSVGRGTYRLARYGLALSKDVSTGVLTGREARLTALKRTKKSLKESAVSIKKIIKQEAINTVKEYRGSDDLGIQAITKPRDAYLKIEQTKKVVTATANTIKTGVQGTVRLTGKTVRAAEKAVEYIAGVIKTVLSKVALIKVIMVTGVVILILSVIMAITSIISSMIPTITLKSDNKEITKTYEYITTLDAELIKEIRGIEKSIFNSDVDEFHFYLNGYQIASDEINIYTNIDAVLLYLDSKYNDYAFDKFVYGLFGGINVKEEVRKLHALLHNYITNKWVETIEHEDGSTTKITHMNIIITTKSFESYYSQNKDVILTLQEQEQLEVLKNIGMYTTKIELGNPFINQSYYISNRWGWYIDQDTGDITKHTGIDIPKPAGTPINNVMRGTVTTVGYDKDIYGNYVVVMKGNKEVVYAQMGSVAVSVGQELAKGDIIGYVGSTGNAKESHLHLEYKIENGFETNPVFFLEGASHYGQTGKGGGDIVQVAAYEIGNISGSIYKKWIGLSEEQPWCAAFVSWCAEQLGYLQEDIMPKFQLCTTGAQWFIENGQWYSRDSGYTPVPGDIIFFTGSERFTQHVGIVESCDGITVYTIEGNSSDQVRRRSYNMESTYVYGYGVPEYN